MKQTSLSRNIYHYKVVEIDVIIDRHFNLCNKYWYIFLEKEGSVIVLSMLQYIPEGQFCH